MTRKRMCICAGALLAKTRCSRKPRKESRRFSADSISAGLVRTPITGYCIYPDVHSYNKARGELMRIRQTDSNEITDICREEMEEASRRIIDRLKQFERRPASSTDDQLEGVRRFYEDLADKNWTKADEDTLKGLEGVGEEEVKVRMREGF